MDYFIHLAILFSIYGILALSLNLVVGYTGLISLAHAAFFGFGAYATAISMTKFGTNFFLSVLIGMVVAASLATLIGIVLSRLKGDYYTLGSLGFNLIAWSIFINFEQLTRGPLGIPGIPRPQFFGIHFSDNFSFLLLTLVFLALVYALSRFVVTSSFGRVLKAIREDEKAIQIFGYKTQNYKLLIFVIAGALAAIAGSLFASYISFIDPYNFTINESVFMLSIIILGGLANVRGALLGALFLVLLPEFLRFVGFPPDIAAQTRLVVYGLMLVILMLYRPQGLLGEYKL
ncbi:MAG: branched-chain amino acid ABC transporter permease [Patescibacteria group bacterium]